MTYIKKFSIISVGRFISRSIQGKICITLCDVTPIGHQTNKWIGLPVEIHPYIVKCHICKKFKLGSNKFKEPGCCEQPVCNVCIRQSGKVHKCSTCGLMKCNTCTFLRFFRCGKYDETRKRKNRVLYKMLDEDFCEQGFSLCWL